MIYEWLIRAEVNGLKFEDKYLGTTENDARTQFEESICDYTYGKPRYKSVTKTGMVLVHESQVKK